METKICKNEELTFFSFKERIGRNSLLLSFFSVLFNRHSQIQSKKLARKKKLFSSKNVDWIPSNGGYSISIYLSFVSFYHPLYLYLDVIDGLILDYMPNSCVNTQRTHLNNNINTLNE